MYLILFVDLHSLPLTHQKKQITKLINESQDIHVTNKENALPKEILHVLIFFWNLIRD